VASVQAGADLTRGFAEAVAELEATGMSRKTIAEYVGVEPSTISRWVTGERSVPIEHLPKVDALCGQPLGHVLYLAGYIEPVDVPAAIAADPALTPRYKRELTGYYAFVRTLSADADR
jgi:transcriptional regulator with XRE-family HTH domain